MRGGLRSGGPLAGRQRDGGVRHRQAVDRRRLGRCASVLVTLLALRDGAGATGFCGADLRYGMFDLRLTGGARLYEGVALEAKTLAWCLDLCFDDDVRDSAPASPILADLRGMPPALLTVGTNDSLLEDSLLMYARWRGAGRRT